MKFSQVSFTLGSMGLAEGLPSGIEVRRFRIGPLPAGDEKYIPPDIAANLPKVQAGEAHENDVNIKVPELTRVMDTVAEEIVMFAKAYLLNSGVSLTQVEAAVARVREAGRAGELEDPLKTGTLEEVQARVVERILFRIRLALQESLINHIEHGNKDPHLPIEGAYWLNGDGILHVESADSGQGFDPATVPSPLEAIMLEQPFGRGLLLERTFMDSVEYGCSGTTGKLGTSLHMKKHLAKLDERVLPADEDSETDKFEELELDRHTRHCIAELLAERKRATAEQAAKQAFEREWFGLKHALIEWLHGRRTIRGMIGNAVRALKPRNKKTEA